MALVFVGTDFRGAALRELERLSEVAEPVRARLRAADSGLSGSLFLSTCNRFEVYAEAEEPTVAIERIIAAVRSALLEYASEHSDPAAADALEPSAVAAAADRLHGLHGEAVIERAHRVAAGLESMIVGDSEINGQVRRALLDAQRAGAASAGLSTLFQHATRAAKRVGRETGIGATGSTVVSSALDLAAERLPIGPERSALVIGTGAYARVIVGALRARGVHRIAVYSRSGHAARFAAANGLRAITTAALTSELAGSDLVLSASGSGGFVVDRERAAAALAERASSEPLVFVDVAVRRDIDPAVAELPGSVLIDLEVLAAHTPHQASAAEAAARRIIAEEVEAFDSRLRAREIDPVIAKLRHRVGSVVEREVAAVRRRHGEAAAEDVARSLRRVTNHLLHTPSVRARQLAAHGAPDDYLRAVELLFDLEGGPRG